MNSRRKRKLKKKTRRLARINNNSNTYINDISKEIIQDKNRKLDVEIKEEDSDILNDNYTESDDLCIYEVKTIEIKLLNSTFSESVSPTGMTGTFFAKIPIVLSQMKLEICCNAEMEFPQTIEEIRRIKTNTYITQSKVIGESKKILISGFIRESMEYTVKGHKQIKNIISSIPFEITTDIKYIVEPQINLLYKKREIIKNEKITFTDNEKAFSNKEYFNSRIYCEPICAESNISIVDMKLLDIDDHSKEKNKIIFQDITINLEIRVMQEQIIDFNR